VVLRVSGVLAALATSGLSMPIEAPVRARDSQRLISFLCLLLRLSAAPQRTTAVAIALPRSHKLTTSPQPMLAFA